LIQQNPQLQQVVLPNPTVTLAIAPQLSGALQAKSLTSGLSIPPMKSFKSFVQTLGDDLSPEVFTGKYEQYQLKYLEDFSDAFFNAHKKEEWFRERYDPLKLVELEQSTAEWAVAESINFKASIIGNPTKFIKSVCLDPVHPDVVKSSSQSEKLISGHEDRIVQLNGIPERCSKNQLKAFILNALSNPSKNKYSNDDNARQPIDGIAPCLPPERILISQPSWQRDASPRFERYAWLIMPSVDATHEAVSRLRNLIVQIRAPDNFHSTINPVVLDFTLQATVKTLGQTRNSLPDFMSQALRVEADTLQALALAELIDEERNIPEEARLVAILEAPEVIAAGFPKPTDKLDVCISYLRRVHFIAFYGGRRFLDEGHLLMNFPNIMYRSVPYIPVSESTNKSASEENGPNSAVSDETESSQAVAEAEKNISSDPSTQVTGESTEISVDANEVSELSHARLEGNRNDL